MDSGGSVVNPFNYIGLEGHESNLNLCQAATLGSLRKALNPHLLSCIFYFFLTKVALNKGIKCCKCNKNISNYYSSVVEIRTMAHALTSLSNKSLWWREKVHRTT